MRPTNVQPNTWRIISQTCSRFLRDPAVDATNWRAEQAIRPTVVNRKVWGGNRTWNGAEVQAILMTILVTANQQAINTLDFLKQTLISPQIKLLPISGR